MDARSEAQLLRTNTRPDLAHKFVEGDDPARCAHWFEWLGGLVMCGCQENHPYHTGGK